MANLLINFIPVETPSEKINILIEGNFFFLNFRPFKLTHKNRKKCQNFKLIENEEKNHQKF